MLMKHQCRFVHYLYLPQPKLFAASLKVITDYARTIYPLQNSQHSLFLMRETMLNQLRGRCTWSGGGHSSRLGIQFGHAQAEGVRDHPIEDYHVAATRTVGPNKEKIGLFAIFDGHGGSEVAEFLQQNFFDTVLSHPQFLSDTKLAVRESYHLLDQRVLDMGEKSRAWRSGSTATTAFLMDKGRRLVVANVGDSRAVLCRNGDAVDLSVDHEPQKPNEKEMVESKGGEVSKGMLGDVYRVDRRLAMSRAFGDYDLKAHISVEPDIWDGELSADDEFLIIASDGLWHVMNSQEAVELAGQCSDAKSAAKELIRIALQRSSQDDVSVLVVGIGSFDT